MEVRVETYGPDGSVEVSNYELEVTDDVLRAKREAYFMRTDLWTTVDRWSQLSEEQQNEMTTYRQLLRDLTDREDKDQAYQDIIDKLPEWFV